MFDISYFYACDKERKKHGYLHVGCNIEINVQILSF